MVNVDRTPVLEVSEWFLRVVCVDVFDDADNEGFLDYFSVELLVITENEKKLFKEQ